MLRSLLGSRPARRFLLPHMKRKLDAMTDTHDARAMSTSTGTGTLPLTPREKKLKGLLLDVARSIDAGGADKPREPVVLRWAGGWVRDRLLGVESHDIDTAINCMTGFAFASRLREFCDRPDNAARHGIGPADVGSLHKIAQNPEKSKHLETVTTRVFGLDVDFVNLRRETYAEDSRNPQVEFGTAEEDALRRDATVNALFYNLHTGEVEDLTGGLRDLRARLIRTPMEPLQTFTDDPLRVLRLVRFASRLQFAIDPDAEGVMGDQRVLEALRLKISRERIGVELEKMLKGNYPRDALATIDRLGLYHAIFTDPARTDLPRPETSAWKAAYDCLDRLEAQKTPGSIYDVLVKTDEARYFAWNLAALVPWEQVADPAPAKPGKPPPPYVTLAAREGIKAPNRLSDVVTAAHRHRGEVAQLRDLVGRKDPAMRERDRYGMAIREWEARGGHWRLQVLYAVLFDVLLDARGGGTTGAEHAEVLGKWQELLDHLQELDVLGAPSARRLIDGRELSRALGVKPGKWMAAAMDVCMAWQLRNPGATDPAGAVEEVRRRREELKIDGLLA